MEDIVWRCNLAVKKIRGKDEFEMYKRCINDLPNDRIPMCLHFILEMNKLKEKNDSQAIYVRIQGNNAYKLKDHQESLRLYTKSLRYANYNSKEYAVALANRSAVHFDLEDYKSSIDDINLCLKANYPNHLKPKVYVRKAKCFQKLGKATDMRKILIDLLNYLDSSTGLLKKTTEKYTKVVQDLITAPAENKSNPDDKFDTIPTLEANPNFLNASSSIMLKYNKRRGCHVVTKKEILRGDILFVEKAYTFAPVTDCGSAKKFCPVYCQYCLLKITSSVPCKKCVKHLYCNDECRDTAWKEFHQWECFGVQRGFFKISSCGYYALRIILKAVLTGISTSTINFEDGVTSYGNKDNNYPYVYNLPSNFHKMEKRRLIECMAVAALIVNYLKTKTKFFEWMKQLPAHANKSYKELMNKLGGLIIRHCTQYHRTVGVRILDNDVIPSRIIIANAVCPSMAMMNHSCIPNATYYFVGNTVVVKATENIKVNEVVCYSLGSIPFISLDKALRQKLLYELYYLNCSCQMCSDPRMDTHDSYLCIRCKGPAPPLDIDHPFASVQCTCLDCNYKFMLPARVMMRMNLAMAFLLKFCQFEDIDDANRCFEINRTIFTPNHSIFGALDDSLLNFYEQRGEVGCFMKVAKRLLDYTEKKYGLAALLGCLYYVICLKVIEMLQETAVNMPVKRLGDILGDLTNLVERSRMVFTLHYPQFGARLQKVDKAIFQFRVLHTLQIANKKDGTSRVLQNMK